MSIAQLVLIMKTIIQLQLKVIQVVMNMTTSSTQRLLQLVMTISSTQRLLQLVMTTSSTQATDPLGPPSEQPETPALISISACFFSTQALIGGRRLSRFVNII
jgi:hypothetical protein